MRERPVHHNDDVAVGIRVSLFGTFKARQHELAGGGALLCRRAIREPGPGAIGTERRDDLIRQTNQLDAKGNSDSASEAATVVLVSLEAALTGVTHTIRHFTPWESCTAVTCRYANGLPKFRAIEEFYSGQHLAAANLLYDNVLSYVVTAASGS